jgi:PPE family
MAIKVDPDSLAADATALADWQTGGSTPGCEPASAHSVSIGVAAQLSAHSASLAALINHAHQVRAEGGAATLHTAASLRAADEAGADVIAGKASTSEVVSAPTASAAVPAPVLPGIPSMPPLAPIPGEAHAVALHTGPGATSLREFADYWQSQAATLDNVAADTSQTSVSIDVHWSDGSQRAGANTAVHGRWWSDLAGRARALASAANEAADHHDRAVTATPTPQEFADAHNRLAQANAANVASRGLLSGQVSAAAAHLAQLQCQASDAAAAHHAASSATTNAIPGSPGSAPPIATGGGGASATQGGNGAANQNPAATGSAQLASSPALAAGTGSMDQMAQSLLPMAEMLPMLAMAPMSALSGLSGLSRQSTPSTMAARAGDWPDEAADSGLPADLGDTMPAAGGGGGAEVGSGAAPSLPVSSPSPPSPSAVSGPAASVAIPAESAATAPAGASAAGGMTTYPPMMGAPGAGDGGAHRDMRLYPDRRVVWRPVPNTEAVFGELQRERRPRGKRAAPEEATDQAGGGHQ